MKQKHVFGQSQTVAFCGLAIALIAVSAWIVVPFGMIPFTLQTLTVSLVLMAFPAKQARISVLGYLLLGAVGVPVFSSMRGGLGVLMGPTGGFLLGYAVAALLIPLLLKVWKEPQSAEQESSKAKIGRAQYARYLVAGLAFMLIADVCGWLQLMVMANLGPAEAFVVSVAPFVLVDIIKVAVAARVAQTLKKSIPVLRAAA